jgi:hypothetical protein
MRELNRRYREYTVPLQEHLEKLVFLKFSEVDKAINLASADMERRMNGFPDQFVKKGDADVEIAQLKSDVKVLNDIKNRMEGKASQNSMILALVISIISLLIALGGLLRHFKV